MFRTLEVDMAQLLGTREAAQRAGLSREQVLRRIERGEISARHIEGRWLVDSRSLGDYIAREQRRARAAPQPA